MARSALASRVLDRAAPDTPPCLGSLLVGGIIGLVSGVTAVGRRHILAPLVLSLGWATVRQTAAISVVFNLMNSAAALAGIRGQPCRCCLPDCPSGWSASVGRASRLMDGGAAPQPRTLRLLLAFLLLAAAGRMITVSF